MPSKPDPFLYTVASDQPNSTDQPSPIVVTLDHAAPVQVEITCGSAHFVILLSVVRD